MFALLLFLFLFLCLLIHDCEFIRQIHISHMSFLHRSFFKGRYTVLVCRQTSRLRVRSLLNFFDFLVNKWSKLLFCKFLSPSCLTFECVRFCNHEKLALQLPSPSTYSVYFHFNLCSILEHFHLSWLLFLIERSGILSLTRFSPRYFWRLLAPV